MSLVFLIFDALADNAFGDAVDVMIDFSSLVIPYQALLWTCPINTLYCLRLR